MEWRESVAHGTPNGGWLENGIRLPSEGPGFYTYDPATQAPPGGKERQWGTAVLVRQLIDLGAWWEDYRIRDAQTQNTGNYAPSSFLLNAIDGDYRAIVAYVGVTRTW